MKTATLIGLSIAANIVLAAVVVHLVRNRPAAAPTPPPLTTKSLKTALLATKSGPTTTNASGVVTVEPFKWGQLEAEDYKVYIARLRSIGCPEQTIRDIIIADLDKLYAPTLQQLQKRRENLSFWNSEEEEVLNEVDADATAKAQRDADLEKRRILKELLGADLVAERLRMKGQWDYYERRLSFLPEEKRVDIRDISERFSDEMFAIKAKQWDDGTPLTNEDREQLRKLRLQQESELSAVLSPAEKAQYDLWMSESASKARHDLYGMDATQQEFLTVYGVRKAFDEQFPRDEIDLGDDANRARYEQARQAMDLQIRQQLGETRYETYVRGSDEDFHTLTAVATKFQMPKTKAAEVYNIKKDVLKAEMQILTNNQVSNEQRMAMIAALRAEAAKATQQALGEKAYRAYVRQYKPDWLVQ